MSTRADTVASALTDEPQSRVQIADFLGIEAQAVSCELTALRANGRALKTPDGWVSGDGVKPRVHLIEPHEPPEPPKPAKARRKKAKREKRPAEDADPSARNRSNVSSVIECQKFGDYVILKLDDVVELLAVMAKWNGLVVSEQR